MKRLPPVPSTAHDPLWFTIKPEEGISSFITEPFDSEIQNCQWHRITVKGKVPPGSSVLFRTYTSDLKLNSDAIANLDDDVWMAHPIARTINSEWDCLIRSRAGRYLWLRVDTVDAGTETASLESVSIEYPRISLRKYLPATFGASTEAADFTDRFLGIFDTTLRSIESQIDDQAALFDPMSTPSKRGSGDFLTWLASWVGVWMDQRWSEQRRRKFLQKSLKLFDKRGTPEGIWELLLIFLEFDENKEIAPPLVLEHFKLRRWLFLGVGRLGEDAVLWGQKIVNRAQLNANVALGGSHLIGAQDPSRDPFHVYAHKFSVFVPASIGNSPQERRSLEQLLKVESPAHSEFSIEYVNPSFRIGIQSVIGFDTVVGRYPLEGVRVGADLGRDTVLTKRSNKHSSLDAVRLGLDSRLG